MIQGKQPKATAPSWVRGYLLVYRGQIVKALGLGVLAFACSALLMFVSGYLMSRTAQAGVTLFMVMTPIACVQLFGLGRPFAHYVERLISHDWVFRITSLLRRTLFDSISRIPPGSAEQHSAGEYLGVLDDDIGHLQNLYLRVVFPTVIAYALYVGASALFGFFTLELFVTMLIAGAVTAILLPLVSLLATRALSSKAKDLRAEEYALLTDDVFGSQDWALSGRSKEVTARHMQLDDSVRQSDAKVKRTLRIAEFASTLLLGAAICIALGCAATSFGASQDAANWIAAIVIGFFPLIEVFSVLPASMSSMTAHADALRNLDRYIGDDKRDAKPDRLPASPAKAPSPLEANANPTAIRARTLSFSYQTSKHVILNDIDLDIGPGQHVAILGKSGSGKSTFAKLLRADVHPTSGMLYVNGTLTTDPNYDATAAIAYVSQDSHVFNRPLRDNLLIANPAASDADLVEALCRVKLDGKLNSLEEGLDTVMGETGTGLSGGESQRIALARALLADTPTILLDEPFTALDPATEHEVIETLLDAFEGKTLVLITHHLMDIERFDRVLFLEDGTLAMDGAPAELARSNSRFKQLLEFDRGLAF